MISFELTTAVTILISYYYFNINDMYVLMSSSRSVSAVVDTSIMQ